MKYFKHPKTQEVFAYGSEEERQSWWVPELIAMTDTEVCAYLDNQFPKTTPQQVTRAQGKAELIKRGLWSDARAFVESIKDPTEKALGFVALDDTTHWHRNSPSLNSVAGALKLSESDMDDLFIKASEIEL